MRFRAELQRTGGTATGFQVPDEVVVSLGGGGRPKVVATVNGYRFRSSIAKMGDSYWLGGSAERRAEGGVGGGGGLGGGGCRGRRGAGRGRRARRGPARDRGAGRSARRARRGAGGEGILGDPVVQQPALPRRPADRRQDGGDPSPAAGEVAGAALRGQGALAPCSTETSGSVSRGGGDLGVGQG